MTLPDKNRIFWWVYVLALGAGALYIAHSFVGILVIGVFGYYATRPICARIERGVESNRLAAALTVLTVLVPVLVLAIYAGIRTFRQIQQQFDGDVVSMFLSRVAGLDAEGLDIESLTSDPPSIDQLSNLVFGSAVEQGLHALDLLLGTALLLSLGVTLSYALLAHDEALSTAFARLAGGEEAAVCAYARAVDSDLESVFFGNLLFVAVMSLVATVTYTLTNLVLPSGMNVPMAFTLGVLTGFASLVPLVVGKVVYVPVVAYLAISTAQDGSDRFLLVGGVLAAYVLLLDIIPQSFLQPIISGRQLNPMILLFAYILGPVLWGWYGFFLLPIVFVLILEAIRVALPELLYGDSVEAKPQVAEEMGADAKEVDADDEEMDADDEEMSVDDEGSQDNDPDVSPAPED